MKSICLFSSYFNKQVIPYYIKFYLEELKKHFSKVVFITNQKELTLEDLTYLHKNNFTLKLVSNEGFDFGMWYKGLQEIRTKEYDRIALVNDSCVLFKSLKSTFDWINNSDFDYCGLVSSRRIQFHIQSFFIVINKKAIDHVLNYFNQHGIINEYRNVINVYELGLCLYVQQQNLKTGALYSNKEKTEVHNPSFNNLDEFIVAGIPMIKKKIIFRTYRYGEYLSLFRMNFNLNPQHYISNIKKVNAEDNLIDFNLVLEEHEKKNNFDIYLYNILKSVYRITNSSKILTHLFHHLILIRRKKRGDNSTEIVKTSIRNQ